jgi:septum formation inhibitor-activating ATPase MinD
VTKPSEVDSPAVTEDLLRHALRKIDEAVVVADIDVTDVSAVEAGLVRDRADDVTGLYAVDMTHLDPERLRG